VGSCWKSRSHEEKVDFSSTWNFMGAAILKLDLLKIQNDFIYKKIKTKNYCLLQVRKQYFK
jgi:hypothetical protein